LGGKRFARISADPTAPEFEYRGEILSAEEFTALKRLGRSRRGTVFTTMLAALARAVGTQHNSGDLLFSTVFRKRNSPQWRNTLGPCFALTCIPLPAPPVTLTADYARVVRDNVLHCYQHNRFDPIALHLGGRDGAWREAAAVRLWRDVADQVRRG
jgi:hypothetical protein